MAATSDDLAAQLERFFRSRYPADATAPATPAPAEPANGRAVTDGPAADVAPSQPPTSAPAVDAVVANEPIELIVAGLRAALASELEELIDPVVGVLQLQLAAFEERLSIAVAAGVGGSPTDEAAVETLNSNLGALRTQLDAAFSEVLARVNRVEVRLDAKSALTASELQATIELLRQDLATYTAGPIQVDTSALEKLAYEADLRNAADIASLRQQVEELVGAVRLQAKGIEKTRSTLNWIKDRLLR